MSDAEKSILDRVNADYWAELYQCRWSPPDAERVVPELAQLLGSDDPLLVDEALRALCRIGPLAILAAKPVSKLIQSRLPITKYLAVLTLGQIAHTVPELCVEPLASVLDDPECCRIAMGTLAFIGSKAEAALDRVLPLFRDNHAKVRKTALVTAASIKPDHPAVLEILHLASKDRSKIVRDAALKFLLSQK